MRNSIGARDIVTSRDLMVNQLPISNDTSRSPIPIDAETYKNMHRDLPRKMDASSLGKNDRSSSREPSVNEGSISSLENVRNQNAYTQVQPFIMSPQNLQETLKK